MLVTMSFTILSLSPVFKLGSACRIIRPLRNNTGRILVHHATWHTSNRTLFTPLLIFKEWGNMEPLNGHLANLKQPQSSMEPINRREPDDYRSSINIRFATIHFPETRLHGRLELERGTISFLEKEPSHLMIHFPRHIYTVYAILQERGVSACINRWPYFPSALCLVVVAPSYSALTPHPSLFIVCAL
jgi:hypothetical protein